MARYAETKVTLTANQAAGTDPILAAETATPGMRKALLVGNPTATAMNLHLATGATHGTGMPVPAGTMLGLDHAAPGFDGALYCTGLSLGDVVTLWTA